MRWLPTSPRIRRAARIAAISLGAILALLLVLFGALQLQGTRDALRARIAAATAGTGNAITIGGLDGTLPFDLRLRDVAIADAGGPWLTIDRLDLAWSPLALLTGTLRIDAIEAGRVAVLRTPQSAPEDADERAGFSLPSLPVDLDLRRVWIGRIDLAEPILGAPAALQAEARAQLGRLGEQLALNLQLRQVDGAAGDALLDLSYSPEADRLVLDASISEPQGGLVGRLLGLPPRSDFQVTATGSGPLADWRGGAVAELDGATILDLQGDVTGDAPRRIAVTLSAAPPAALVPETVAPLLQDLSADGALRYEPADETLQIEDLAASSAAGRLHAAGAIGAALDLTLRFEAAGPEIYAALLPEATWSAAHIDAKLGGTRDAPQVAAQAMLRDIQVPQGRIGTFAVDLAADAAAGLDQPIALDFKAAGSDIAPADARLAPLLAGGLRVALQGSATTAGDLVVEALEATGGGITVQAAGSADDWGAKDIQAAGSLAVADLAVLQPLLPLAAQGGLDLAFRADPAEGGSRIDLMGAAHDLAFGQAALDGLLGPVPAFSASLLASVAGATLEQADLTGAALQASATGTAGTALDLKLAAAITDLAALTPQAAGRLDLDAALTGRPEAPALDLQARAARLAIAGRELRDLALAAAATDLTAPRVTAEATARIAGLPADARIEAAIQGAAVDAPRVSLRLGRATLDGKLAYDGAIASGALAFEAPDLAEAGGLIGTALRGRLAGELALQGGEGRQELRLTATGAELAFADQAMAQRAEISARVADLFGAPVIEGRVDLNRLSTGGETFDTAQLTARGGLDDLQAELAAEGEGTDLQAAAGIAMAEQRTSIALTRLEGAYRGIGLRSVAPAQLELTPEVTRLDGLALAVEDGMLRADGAFRGEVVEAALRLERLPLSLLRVAAPDLAISGTLDGAVEISGPIAAPDGRIALEAHDVATPGLAKTAELRVNGALRQGGFDLTGSAELGAQGRLDLAAAAPALAATAPLTASAKGKIDLVLLDAFLAGGADRVRGGVDLDLSLGGTLGAPQARGGATLAGVEYDNLRYGIKLRQIAAELRAEGGRIDIAGLTARGPGGGRVEGGGSIALAEGPRLDLALRLDRLRVIDSELASAIIGGELALTGSAAERLALTGAIRVREAEIRVPDSLPPQVQEIPVIEVNTPPALQQAAATAAQPEQSLDLDLDLAVDAPQQVFVRGRGLDAELGGALRIGGSAAQPDIAGALDLRRGALDLVGKRLDFKSGTITLESGTEINPLLDLTATTRAEQFEVTAKVEGPAKAPRITLSSVPDLPQDEILARLLFGKSVGALSPFELLQLAQATAQLAGIQSGPGILDAIRQKTGLDRLTLEQAEGAAGPSLGAGRYVAKGVYVGVTQGAQSNSGTATVEIEVTPNVKLETELGANGSGKTGVNLEWDY